MSNAIAQPLIARNAPMPTGLLLGGAALAGIGLLFVLYNLFTQGHAAFNTSSEVAWGLPISFYVFLALSSSGLTILASLALVFGQKAYYAIAKRCIWMAIVTLVAGFAVLALELGHPFRMLWAIPLGMQIKSPMFWMGVFYTLDLILLLYKFWLMHTGDWNSQNSKRVGIASLVAVVAASGTLAMVFGLMAMRPAWYDPMMPVYFIISGFLSAVAFVLFFMQMPTNNKKGNAETGGLLASTLPRLTVVLLFATLIMVISRTATGLWSNADGLDALRHSLSQAPYQIALWIGLLLPLVLLIGKGGSNATRQWLASLAILVGLVFARLDMMIVGQSVPLFKGQWVRGFNEYWPSATEWMLVPFGFGAVLFLYAIGEWLFRLSDKPE